jgi:hypothetical protein
VVAEEFQPLIAVGTMAGRGLQRGNMREGGRQQRRIGELVADAPLDRRGRRLGAGLAALLLRRSLAAGIHLLARFFRGRRFRDDRCFVVHRTIVNRRFQRMAVGQRQNIQACSPSAMEKKIICARPTMFSNGT